MSDSDAEFESADEGGNKSDDGWEIDCDFDLPDVQNPEQDAKTCKRVPVVEPPGKDSVVAADPIPTLQSRLDKLAVCTDNSNCGPLISEENEVVEIETKPPTTPSSNVSENRLFQL